MAKFQFMFSDNWYTEQGAETMLHSGTKDDIATMRAEYTRMRDVAQKRIQRLEKDFSESKTFQNNIEGFKKLKDIDQKDFASAFSELAKFVKAKSSTVVGQRQMMQKTMNRINDATGASEIDEETGEPMATPLNKGNYWRFIKILDNARKQKISYGSEKMVQLADSTLMLSSDQFDQVLDNLGRMLEHSEEVQEAIESQYDSQTGYQMVDMGDLADKLGW